MCSKSRFFFWFSPPPPCLIIIFGGSFAFLHFSPYVTLLAETTSFSKSIWGFSAVGYADQASRTQHEAHSFQWSRWLVSAWTKVVLHFGFRVTFALCCAIERVAVMSLPIMRLQLTRCIGIHQPIKMSSGSLEANIFKIYKEKKIHFEPCYMSKVILSILLKVYLGFRDFFRLVYIAAPQVATGEKFCAALLTVQ